MRFVLLKTLRTQYRFMLLQSVFTPGALYLFSALMLLSSCRKFEGEQTIPAYLRIDTITKHTDYFTYGSSTHNITDAWVYVNDQLIGAFELPATFPVLATGMNKVEIRPGIKLNGISATRVNYPFYKPYIVSDFGFVEDSVSLLSPTTDYIETTKIPWLEDFENVSITLEKTNQSDTSIVKTQPINNPDALLSEFSAHSGLIHLTGNNSRFEVATGESFALPGQGNPVFLEIDYKCDKPFRVGLFVDENATITSYPLLIVNKSAIWNKIYINLAPTISQFGNAARYKLFFSGSLDDTDEEAKFFFDNIKLVHR